MAETSDSRPLALITGASRRMGMGAEIAIRLAQDGWNIATTCWRPYDESDTWGSDPNDVEWLSKKLAASGVRTATIEADLSLVESPKQIFDDVERAIGPVTALILSHCHGRNSNILNTSVESFDQHFAVNTRASWLLVRELGRRFQNSSGSGRIIALTSDHVVGNLPYGASKGAMDRIVLAAAHDFQDQGITANVINPGPTDTGWMTPQQIEQFSQQTPGSRPGLPYDCANLVRFLCSEEGRWINGQLLHSNGGFQ